MFGAATNTNKFYIATGGPVLANGEHITGGRMAVRSQAAARGLFAVHGWVSGPHGRLIPTLYALFFNLAPGLVAAPGIRKVYSCA